MKTKLTANKSMSSLLLNMQAIQTTSLPLASKQSTSLRQKHTNLSKIEKEKQLLIAKKKEKLIKEYWELENLQSNNDGDDDLNPIKLTLEGHPICKKVNYLFGVWCVVGSRVIVDGVNLLDFKYVEQWNKMNGEKIMTFLLQVCSVLNEVSQGRQIYNLETIKHEAKQVLIIFEKLLGLSNRCEKIKLINSQIFTNLPLQSVEPMNISPEEEIEIRDYFVEQVISFSSASNSPFLHKLLEKIDVTDEDEHQLITNPKVVECLLKEILIEQYCECDELFQKIKQKTNYDTYETKHFTSADTALETMETVKRGSGQGIHFVMDEDYLTTLIEVLIEELSRMLKINENIVPCLVLENLGGNSDEYEIENIKNSAFETIVTSPKQIFNNKWILTNLVGLLENSIKRIIFQKIKKLKSKFEIKRSVSTIVNVVSRYQRSLEFDVLVKLVENIQEDRKYKDILIEKRLKRMFLFWKYLKANKLKLFKSIIVKKSKADIFLCSIAIAKWRMNTRSSKIDKMICKTLENISLPVTQSSKKGIEIAYKRVSSFIRHKGIR